VIPWGFMGNHIIMEVPSRGDLVSSFLAPQLSGNVPVIHSIVIQLAYGTAVKFLLILPAFANHP
jgi:hypothetical protein